MGLEGVIQFHSQPNIQMSSQLEAMMSMVNMLSCLQRVTILTSSVWHKMSGLQVSDFHLFAFLVYLKFHICGHKVIILRFLPEYGRRNIRELYVDKICKVRLIGGGGSFVPILAYFGPFVLIWGQYWGGVGGGGEKAGFCKNRTPLVSQKKKQ